MRELAPNLWQLGGFPPDAFNVYLIGDVLIDAATRWGGGRILRQIGDRRLSMLALTHVHPDHQGCARMICERYAIPLACHAKDVATMEGRQPMQPNHFLMRWFSPVWSGPSCPVTRVLQEGDEVGGFRVIHAPGHTPGHIVLFRESDRVAVVGDLMSSMNLTLTWRGLREPPALFCTDKMENRRSILKLAVLEPSLLCFGHGPPLSDMNRFDRFLKRVAARTT
jgi:hydroxyacylglutathione hydrolase